MFIHENENWTTFRWDNEKINALQLKVMHSLGYLSGRMSAIGFEDSLAATVEAMTNDVVASSEMEGVKLDTAEVRSSVAKRLGVKINDIKDPTHYVDGIVEMMLDATHKFNKPLSKERLMKWHTALFPNRPDMTVGAYRTDEMSVVSGTFGRERIHYRAPSPDRVEAEMEYFIDSFNTPGQIGVMVKAAIAHLWFVSIHPFDDGNGRIARAISDMVLAGLDGEKMHFYTLSTQILKDKNHYYKILERTQRGDGDITEWIEWFLNAIQAAVDDSGAMLSMVLRKATFWHNHTHATISERQRMVLNKYLDGYDAKLTAKNWEKLAGVSKDTALRDIDALVRQDILIPTPGRVRDIPYSISYTSKPAENTPFTDISIEESKGCKYITAKYTDGTKLKDRMLNADITRLENGEITLQDLAYKYFAYLLP